MNYGRSHPGAWLLLIVFSFNVIVPASAGRWLWCIGCGDVGLTLTQADSTLLGPSDSCCGNSNPSEEDQRSDQLIADESFSACDCVRVLVENHDLAVVSSSPNGGASAFAYAFALPNGSSAEDVLLDPPTGSVTARGPPDAGWLPGTQTLLGQSTLLII